MIRTLSERCDELVTRAHETDWHTRASIRDTLTARGRLYRTHQPEVAQLLEAAAAWIAATTPVSGVTVEHASGVALTLMPAEPAMFAGMLDNVAADTLRSAVRVADAARDDAVDSARRWWTAFLHTLGAALTIADAAADLGTELDG